MKTISGAILGAFAVHWFYVDKTCFWIAIGVLVVAGSVEVFLDFMTKLAMKDALVGKAIDGGK